METIDEIRIPHEDVVPGLSGGLLRGQRASAKADGGGAAPRNGNLADQVVTAAPGYRSRAPPVHTLLGEIGLPGDTLHRPHRLQDLSKIIDTEPSAPATAGWFRPPTSP